MTKFLTTKFPRVLLIIVLVFLGLLLALQARNSLHWRIEQDTPLLHYAAFLMNEYDAVPYRDIFETSMPGTFFFHGVIGRLFGYSDPAFFIINLVILAFMLAAAFHFMARFGKTSALFGIILFGLIYFGKGQTIILQRDFIGLFPIVMALLLIPVEPEKSVSFTRFALMGFLLGTASLFKPQLAISLPIFLFYFLWLRRRNQPHPKLLRGLLITGAGFLLPIALSLLWLWANGALKAFLDIFWNYLPLHTGLSGGHEAIRGSERILYLVRNTIRVGGYPTLLLCAMIVAGWLITKRKETSGKFASIWFLLALTAAYMIYPILGGKFWSYHYLPFAFFVSLSATLCITLFFELQSNNRNGLALLILAIFLGSLFLELDPVKYTQNVVADITPDAAAHAPKQGRVDELAKWLESNLPQGDTVQPLDWTGGSIHAMLIAEAKLATRFMYDYHFYHDVSNPYIQGLRETFIKELETAQPRYIIQVIENKPWVSGVDTTREFPELEELLTENYSLAFEGDGYIILEKAAKVP